MRDHTGNHILFEAFTFDEQTVVEQFIETGRAHLADIIRAILIDRSHDARLNNYVIQNKTRDRISPEKKHGV